MLSLSSTLGGADMWAVFLLVTLLAGHPDPGPETLPRATVLVDSGAHQLVIQLPPVDVPGAGRGREAMVGLPLCQVLVPVDASLHSSHVEVVDGSGRLLPREMLHHFNLSDPEHRELFLPIGLHLLAASRETPAITVPRLLFGLPLARGQRLIAGAMLANTSDVAYRRVHVRLVLHYVSGGLPWPLYRTYPWAIDVQYPLGRPGTGSRPSNFPPGLPGGSGEGSPASPAPSLGRGGTWTASAAGP